MGKIIVSLYYTYFFFFLTVFKLLLKNFQVEGDESDGTPKLGK